MERVQRGAMKMIKRLEYLSYKDRLGGEWLKSSPEEQDLGVLVGEKPESQPYLGLHQEKRGQQGEGGDSAPLLCSCETPPGVLHPAVEASAQESHEGLEHLL